MLRVEHTRMRRAVIYDMHEGLVRDRLVRAIGTTRASATRIVDMTSNPARYVCSQLAGLYREIPEVSPPDGAEETAAAVAEAGLWQLMARVQRDTIAYNDLFVRVDVGPDGTPAFRIVPPDLVEVVSSPLAPSQPLAICEWIPDPDNAGKWVQLRCDPRVRLYGAYDADGLDVSDRVLGGTYSGDAYPFLVGGAPVLPYVAYHSTESGHLLDPYSGRDIYEGAIQLGMFYSFFGHALRQASWAQRWAVGLELVGGDVASDEGGAPRRDAVQDPATLAMFRLSEEGGNAQIGQWSAPVDPDRMYGAIERYERRLVESALSQVGVSRRESDVRSAMSLAVSREAQRDAQRAYTPVFARSDRALLRLVSGLRGEPTDGWRISYRSLPRDASELAAEMERMQGLIASGLLDRVTAYQQLHPGLTSQEAEAAVARIAEINAQYGDGSSAAPGITHP